MSIAKTQDHLLVNLMSAATQRYQVLANNLANQNTAGFIRKTVEFEDLLARELQEQRPDVLSIEPLVLEDTTTPAGADGNNVNMELETTALLQNRLQYELYSTILAGRMELLRTAIQDGR